MFIIYQILYIFFLIFYMLTFAFKKRRREGIGLRFGIYPDELKERLNKRKNIWIHAVSVGEVMTAKTLVSKLKEELSQYTVVVSTVTETGNSVAKKIMPKEVVLTYLPLDLTFIVEGVIKLIKPALFVMIETEIWPNLIRILHKNRVPVLLSNGRISPNSYKWYKSVRPILKNILDCITAFLMRTKEDAERIVSVGAQEEKVTVAGNMKFDSADFSINEEGKQQMYKLLSLDNRRLIVAGSTHPGEEGILLEAYSRLKEKHNDLSLLIAPRHIERTEELIKLIKSYGFTPAKISQLTTNHEIYILDTMGQLKLFYSLAWAVFVGGSLVKHGGQNMIEPAFFGKPILFGPHTFNFKDVASSFLDERAALLVKDRQTLMETIEMLYGNEAFAKETGKHAREIVRANQGATSKTINTIKTILQC